MEAVSPNWQRGAFRLCIIASVLWMLGMGWYQFQGEPVRKQEGVVISLSDDAQLTIDESGIRKQDKDELRMQKLAIVLLPALALVLLVPVIGWVTKGFKK